MTSLRAVLIAAAAALLIAAAGARAQEKLPPRPDRYFNDYAHVVDPDTADSLNEELANFERQTSNQILAIVYPKLDSQDDVAEYCTRVARSWNVGQAGRNNGAVLFVFIQDHKTWIATGYGLEGALPDATCDSILNDVMKPRFHQGDFAGGFQAGLQAMMAATRGEYHGTGHTVTEQHEQHTANAGDLVFLIIFLLIFFINIFRGTRGVMYSGIGRGLYTGMLLGGLGGGGGGGGGFSSGGFSGGGGSFGGGGAGGSW